MPFVRNFLANRYFPAPNIPFGAFLDGVFFSPIEDNLDFPIHGPNVLRLTRALVDGKLDAPGLIKTRDEIGGVTDIYLRSYSAVMKALEASIETHSADRREQVRELLTVAALFHDIGKYIRKAKHAQIGVNLLRNYDETLRKNLVDGLAFTTDDPSSNSKENRFSLISSIIQHHDKFGVVSTGEGGLPIFSDILYFSSNADALDGIRKNITSVMLVNLADMAAVYTVQDSIQLEARLYAARIAQLRSGAPFRVPKGVSADLAQSVSEMSQEEAFEAWGALIERGECCLGLTSAMIANVLSDWSILINAVQNNQVRGSRIALKLFLLQAEKNPARTIERILRLLHAVSSAVDASTLQEYISTTTVESVLVGTLGAHQFQRFCEQFATVAKLDYALAFFRAVMCACVRSALGVQALLPKPLCGLLTPEESSALKNLDSRSKSILSDRLTILFVRVLESLVGRYSGVLDHSASHPRRFGFQLRDLTLDDKIRESIVRLLCVDEQKEPIALTWIADEVTIWSMD
ncbi:MAG: HD domain-containing protein [Terracidiphilus sp.]